jgi:hypothetical protein
VVVVFLRWQIPLQVSMGQWQLYGQVSNPPVFRLDLSSWPYLLVLAVLALAFIFTDAARLETEAAPTTGPLAWFLSHSACWL